MKKFEKWFWLCLIIILWVFGGIGITWQAYNSATIDQTLEAIKTAFIVLGGMGVVLAIYFNVLQSIESNKIIREKLTWDRKENSFKIIEKWDNEAFSTARTYSRHLAENGRTLAIDDLISAVDSDPKLKLSITQLVNYWDEIRISIIADRIDENLVRYALQSSTLIHFKIFEPWLKEESRRNGHLHFYHDPQQLYLRWSDLPLSPPELV